MIRIGLMTHTTATMHVWHIDCDYGTVTTPFACGTNLQRVLFYHTYLSSFVIIGLLPFKVVSYPHVNYTMRFKDVLIFRMEAPLRILSLDDGGVRGLSSLFILNAIVDEIKLKLIHDFKPLEPIPPIRPCQIFDLICGTSTGGLIALMLGRLEMVCFSQSDKEKSYLLIDC